MSECQINAEIHANASSCPFIERKHWRLANAHDALVHLFVLLRGRRPALGSDTSFISCSSGRVFFCGSRSAYYNGRQGTDESPWTHPLPKPKWFASRSCLDGMAARIHCFLRGSFLAYRFEQVVERRSQGCTVEHGFSRAQRFVPWCSREVGMCMAC